MGLIVDSFAGGGGASTGIEAALNRAVDIAINHNERALALHAVNHPHTRHIIDDVWRARPRDVCHGQPVDVAWFSPDCTHFSKAKGGKPNRDPNRAKRSRGLAWVIIRWAAQVRPRVIFMENVEEWRDWSPLNKDGTVNKARKGETRKRFVSQLERLGYVVEMRDVRAMIYGAPTIRKRLVMIARCDGLPIVWPAATHGKPNGDLFDVPLKPYRTAADIIDWSLPCPSIFERKKDLAGATHRRIAKGIHRYVLTNAKPFIVPITHHGARRETTMEDPLPTVTCAQRGEFAFVTPYIVGVAHGEGAGRGKADWPIDEPLRTVTNSPDHALCAPILAGAGGPIYAGKPRPVDAPYATVMKENHTQVVAAFLAQHNTMPGGGVHAGHDARAPLSTITTTGAQQSVVNAFLTKYYGQGGQDQPVDEGLHTIPTKARFALITTEAGTFPISDDERYAAWWVARFIDTHLVEPHMGLPAPIIPGPRAPFVCAVGLPIVDIGMRMLSARELFNAQGFPPDYKIDVDAAGKRFTKTEQIRMCGNSVCPPLAEAIVRANAAFAMAGAARADAVAM